MHTLLADALIAVSVAVAGLVLLIMLIKEKGKPSLGGNSLHLYNIDALSEHQYSLDEDVIANELLSSNLAPFSNMSTDLPKVEVKSYNHYRLNKDQIKAAKRVRDTFFKSPFIVLDDNIED